MGCDIHAYLEYRPGWSTNDQYWWCFAELNISRNYALFEALAGVRGELANAVIPPRGLPKNLAYITQFENVLYISDEKAGREHWCSSADAARWVAKGVSHYANEEKTSVSNPDWHTPSWLTSDEVQLVAERLPDNPDIQMIAALMKASPLTVRLVFWFDN